MRKIPPSLKEKLKSKEYTKYKNTNPQVEVTISRARSSIQDTTYFNTEIIREKEGLSDIAVTPQRLAPLGRPTGIYEIHIDNGIAKTSKRAYPDKKGDGFINQFEVGKAKSVAIAFDGRWELNQRNLWNIKTYEKPYIFWVDNSGALYTQRWDEHNTKQKLAEGVKKVTAIRGWKSVAMPAHDHGVVAAYIKTDGKVYYRNYSEQEDNSFVWENERAVSEFAKKAQSINLFLTNDYRLGFIIEDENETISWAITKRNWAGMAILPEKIHVRPHTLNINFIPIDYLDLSALKETINIKPGKVNLELLYASTDNSFMHIENIPDAEENWGKILIVRVKNEIYNYKESDFEIEDNFNRKYYPESIERIDINTYKLTFTNFNDVGEEGVLRFRANETENGVGDVYEPFKQKFYPKNLVPESLPLPKVEEIYNE
ncbi:hypothetical protein PRVXT_001569 [Proteinivorax tanatarense]|uniref:Uncharacterized protein n=1 Tax=Proteinivorax tanatarense TaxID=1260629 RepID=A0AAU7VHR4_9FIRM